MTRLKIAIQKSGRLSKDSQELLDKAGLQFNRSKDKLFWYGRNLPVDMLLVRDDDIPRLLLDGVCDLGIVGENVATECCLERALPGTQLAPEIRLDFGHCRLCLALPEDQSWQSPQQLAGKRIATSYPGLTQQYLDQQGIQAAIVELSGAVEIAPSMGTAEAIVDLVSTGTTLRANHLRECETLLESQAGVYLGSTPLDEERNALRQRLLERISAVQQVKESKYVMLHAPRRALKAIAELLPGAESPTVLPLEGQEDRVAVHAVCRETVFWEHLEKLKAAGATAVLVLPVEKMLS